MESFSSRISRLIPKLGKPQVDEQSKPPQWIVDRENAVVAAREFTDFIAEIAVWFQEKMQELSKFGLESYEKFELNVKTGELTFFEDGKPKVIAKTQIVGDLQIVASSVEDGLGLWRWSWTYDSIPKHSKDGILKVKKWGEEKGFVSLMDDHFEATDGMCWELIAVCAKRMDAKGGWRIPHSNHLVYVVITDVRWA